MPESKRDATAKAKSLNIPVDHLVKTDIGYFIAPRGITTNAAKRVYAECRRKGGDAANCARIAWSVEKKARKKRE